MALVRIAEAFDRLPSLPGGVNWSLFTFVLGTLGTVLLLFGAPFGPGPDRLLLAVVAAVAWCLMTAIMPRKLLEISRGGPAGRLVLWWMSGSVIEWGLLDPWGTGGRFVLWFALAGFFAFLCHGRYALLVLEESER
jgi:hypothetical protein